MNRGQLIIDSAYNLFTEDEAKSVTNFFNPFLNNKRISENISAGLSGTYLSLGEKVINSLKSLNDIEELGIKVSDSIGVNSFIDPKTGNEVVRSNIYAFGFLPDFRKLGMKNNKFDQQTFNRNNYGKIYKVLIPKGKGEYAVADATIGASKGNFFIKSLSINKTSFLNENASSRLRGDGKINEMIVSKGSDGLVNIGNADYEELVNRLYQYNYGVFKGTKLIDDGSLLDITSRVGSQTQSKNKIVNLLTAFQVQDSFGIKMNSYRNSNSTVGYLSGYELADMLNTNNINKDYTYKMTFGLDSSNEILGITALDKTGKEVKGFINSDQFKLITKESNDFYKKDRVMTRIGHANSRLSDAMQDYGYDGVSDVSRYNNQIREAFKKGNGKITREESYKIANQIVLDYQVKTLDRYGFNNHDDVIHKVDGDAGYVKSFFDYYEKMKANSENTEYMDNLNKNLRFNLDVGTIAGNIYEGRLLNNLSTIGKQSKNTIDTKQFLSQAFLNPLFGENVQGQRKAQSLDRLPELVLNNNGEEVNVAETMRSFFSNVKEMNYKKTQFNYLQRKAMVEKLGEAAGFTKDDMPNVSNSMVRVLYAESDLAFQDSSIYTNSYAMQIPAMFDNAKSFYVSYASLKRDVYVKLTDDQITSFFSELKNKQYDWTQLSSENKSIAEGMIRNLIGEENYSKYNLSRNGDIISELKNIGRSFDGITQIEGKEEEYIRASNNMTGKFNEWLGKFFMKSDANSAIGVLNPDMVDSSILTTISGSNYANIDNIKFTENGIEIGMNRVLIQGHGSKVMNDHIKSTTQVLTNLLGAKFSDGSKMFFEGIINEKYTKDKRGFTGTQFARILTTAAYNAINADYKNVNLSKAQKFERFKKSMIGNDLDGMGNIFNIFNIDMRYDANADTIIFDDKNVQHAINAFDFNAHESLDAMIFDSIRKHRKKIFKKDLVNDEGRILGAYAQEIIAKNYKNLLEQMDSSSQSRFKLYEENFDLLKDYISGDKVGLANLGKITRGWFLLTNNAMMMETKKRKTEEGLKLGRLSALNLAELGMNHIVDYIKNQATSNSKIRMVADYISLAAPKGSMFARGAASLENVAENYFELTFGDNKINIANDVNIYEMANANSNIDTFLDQSPLGKIIKQHFNAEEGTLEKSVKGLIEGFDSEYLINLKKFFNASNESTITNTLGTVSGVSILSDDISFYVNVLKANEKEYGNKISALKKIQERLTENYNKIDSLSSPFRNMSRKFETFDAAQTSIEQIYKEYREDLSNHIVKFFNLSENDENILKEALEYSSNNDIQNKKGFNIVKGITSIIGARNEAIGVASIFDSTDDVDRKKFIGYLKDFSFTKSQSNGINIILNKMFSDGNDDRRYISEVLKGFFMNTDSFVGENIENIKDLEEISNFANIPFIIDSLSSDENGNIVPNAELSKYHKIIRTSAEISDLRNQKKSLEFLTNGEWKKLSAAKTDIDKEFLKKANSRLNDAFNKFSKNLTAEQLDLAKDNIEFINSRYKLTDLKISELSDETFYNILFQAQHKKKVSTSIKMVQDEISAKMLQFKNAVDKDTISSNIKKALNKYGAIKTISENPYSPNMTFDGIQLSNVQKSLLNRLFYSQKDGGTAFNFENFMNEINFYKNNIKNNAVSDNQLEDIYELEKYIKTIIGRTYKDIALFGYNQFSDFVDRLDKGTISYREFMNITDKMSGVSATSSDMRLLQDTTNFIFQNKAQIVDTLDKDIENKSSVLTNLLMTRYNQLANRLYAKGGALYEISTILNKTSSAFSPREASSMTTFIKAEMLELMKTRQRNAQGVVFESQSYKDFKTALSLLYGKDLVKDEIDKFDEIYKQINPNKETVIETIYEIKKKLDHFSHVVFGTKEDWRMAGRLHLFENSNGLYTNVHYGLLSRNPHQYKLSVPAARMVMLNDAAVNLSFIGKYLGSGNKVQSTQSNLMMLGKLTALGAKGDFDGDTFQILSLGSKSLKYNMIKNMDPKEFAKEFDNRSKLFYFLTNMAGTDLKSEFVKSKLGETEKTMIDLISKLYFNGKRITGEEAYEAIESNFLSLSHEKERIIKMLEDETNDHMNIPNAIGFYEFDDKKGIQVSRKSIASFLLTLDDTSRNRFLMGKYDVNKLKEIVEANSRMNTSEKNELLGLINNGNSDVVLKAINKIRNDSEVPLFQTIYNYVNNYLAYTGIAKTGEVHDKLTNFREVIDTLISPEEALRFKKVLGLGEDKIIDILDSKLIYDATMGHEIGDLIESLAISSKKGNVSPDVSLKAFSKGEQLIKENEAFNFNIRTAAKYNKLLGSERLSNSGNTLNELKTKTINEFLSEFYLDSKNILKHVDGQENKNINVFDDLMRAFLTMSTGLNTEEIEKIIKNQNSITIGEIFGSKAESTKLVSAISNWSTVMVVGNLERLTGTKNLNRELHNKLFGNGNIKNFFKRTFELLDIIKIGDKGLGTRLNTSIFSRMGVEDRFEQVIRQTTKERIKEEEATIDIIDSQLSEANKETNDAAYKRHLDNLASEETVEDVVKPETINKTNQNNINSTNASINVENSTIADGAETIDSKDASDIVDNIKTNDAIDNLSNESQDEIKQLKKQIQEINEYVEQLKAELKNTKAKDLDIIKTKQSVIDKLEQTVQWYKDKLKTKANDEFVSNAAEATAEANPTMTQKAVENISNSKLVKASKEAISKHKKMTVAAVGVGVLATFFRIFQSNRPVVNLDINEQEYERSQGSVYRNLGQYTMNTNIRSLY